MRCSYHKYQNISNIFPLPFFKRNVHCRIKEKDNSRCLLTNSTLGDASESTISCKYGISKNYKFYVSIEERTHEENERKRERKIKVADYK